MICTTCYDSPLGKLTLAGKNNKLIGLWIEGQKHFFGNFKDKTKKNDDLAIFRKTEKWLDRYFNGENPSIKNLDLNPQGTDFRLKVWWKRAATTSFWPWATTRRTTICSRRCRATLSPSR